MTGWVVLAVLVAVALAAPRYGADTHTGDSWTAGGGVRPGPRSRATVRGDLLALVRLLGRSFTRPASTPR